MVFDARLLLGALGLGEVMVLEMVVRSTYRSLYLLLLIFSLCSWITCIYFLIVKGINLVTYKGMQKKTLLKFVLTPFEAAWRCMFSIGARSKLQRGSCHLCV